MKRNVVENLKRGITITKYVMFAKNVMKGRFREEVDLDLYLKKDGNEAHLLYIKIFQGRQPHYKAWVELYGIDRKIHIGNNNFDYINSPLENSFLRFLAQYIGPGENMFVDYSKDDETRKQLEVGIPVAVSRLGFKLYKLGFTWFKDWYFPEGFMEGEQKLQAEKPLNKAEGYRQLKNIYVVVKNFLENTQLVDEGNPYLLDALNRAHKIIERKR